MRISHVCICWCNHSERHTYLCYVTDLLQTPFDLKRFRIQDAQLDANDDSADFLSTRVAPPTSKNVDSFRLVYQAEMMLHSIVIHISNTTINRRKCSGPNLLPFWSQSYDFFNLQLQRWRCSRLERFYISEKSFLFYKLAIVHISCSVNFYNAGHRSQVRSRMVKSPKRAFTRKANF
jgi:hypothetical protein